MQTLTGILQQDWINSLGWTLLHSLWQYALIAIFCALLLFFTKAFSANARYLIALASLVIGALISTLTFYKYQQASEEIIMQPVQQSAAAQFFSENTTFSLVRLIDEHIDSIVIAWLCGFLVYGLKIFFDYRYCQQLKNYHLTPTPQKWQHLFAALAAKVGVSHKIELRISTLTVAPCVIGYLKPVVLLPVGLLLGMNQQQIEVILLHELAHARRNDYLVGLIQTLIKILFFFNPFLRWISNQMDIEREHACDDIAVAISQNPLLFANTLKEFADMNINQKLVMNISGKKLLLTRITRLFSNNEKVTTAKNSLLASILIFFTGLILTLCVNAAPENISDKKISLSITNIPVQDVLKEVNKKCSTNEVLTANANESLTLVLEDISCKDTIKLLRDFAAESPAKNSVQ